MRILDYINQGLENKIPEKPLTGSKDLLRPELY